MSCWLDASWDASHSAYASVTWGPPWQILIGAQLPWKMQGSALGSQLQQLTRCFPWIAEGFAGRRLLFVGEYSKSAHCCQSDAFSLILTTGRNSMDIL